VAASGGLPAGPGRARRQGAGRGVGQGAPA